MEANRINLVEQIVKDNAPQLVGELLSNLDALNGEGLNFEQVKSIYKNLLKGKIYQNARNLNTLIRTILVEGRVIFRQKKPIGDKPL